MIPKYLYKYRNWDDPNHKRILTQNEIYFTSAQKFNDPFDSIVPIRFDLGTDEQIRDVLKTFFKKAAPDESDSEIEVAINIFIQSRIYKNQAFLDKFENDFREKKKYSLYGIFTMSAVGDNILLWSHYAKDHKGFCVKFDMDLLRDQFLEHANDKSMIEVREVEYSKDYPELNYFEMSKEEIVLKHVLLKAEDWSYEKEYRAILLNSTNLPFVIHPNTVSEVILGVRIEELTRNEIIHTVKSRFPKAILSQAIRKKVSFGLDFEKIDC